MRCVSIVLACASDALTFVASLCGSRARQVIYVVAVAISVSLTGGWASAGECRVTGDTYYCDPPSYVPSGRVQPDRSKEPGYVPNEAEIDRAAKTHSGIMPESEMKAGLCAFYGTCR
jgi:hypothetical protein